MYYIKIENGIPVGHPIIEENLRYIIPNWSSNMSIENLILAGYAKYQFTDAPNVKWNQTVKEGTPVVDDLGTFVQTWVVEDFTGTELSTARIEFQKEQKVQFKGKTEWRLDEFARTKDYYTILHACSYAVSSDPAIAAEGQHAANLRDATWAKLYQILNEIDNGIRPFDTAFEDIEHELPQLTWPE